MPLTIRQVGADQLPQYAGIPISFMVESVLRVDVVDCGMGGFALVEEKVAEPYLKDYDTAGPGDFRPLRWRERFDTANWAFFIAYDGERAVGAATVAFDTPNVHMLEGRNDLAVLWDLRVQPDVRRSGIGAELFRHAVEWARGKGCAQMKIETQNINVPACRFYARHGCTLGVVNRHAYASCPDIAHEVMLLWYLDLKR